MKFPGFSFDKKIRRRRRRRRRQQQQQQQQQEADRPTASNFPLVKRASRRQVPPKAIRVACLSINVYRTTTMTSKESSSPPASPVMKRSSLRLSAEWSSPPSPSSLLVSTKNQKKKNESMVDKLPEDMNSSDVNAPPQDSTFQLAFFPLLRENLLQRDKSRRAIGKEKDQEEEEDDDDASDITVADSVVSDVFSFAGYSSTFDTAPSSFHDANDIWQEVPMESPDAILGIASNFRACKHPNKVNVAVGAYRDENGRPWILPSVKAAEYKLLDNPHETREYLPIEGDKDYVAHAMRFAYGPDMDLQHLAAVQTLSGTGACRVGACFLAKFWPKHPIYIPNPTWGNHKAIFNAAGLAVKQYRYYDKTKNCLDLNGMLQDIFDAPDGSIILLHACAHNPTGCDPDIDEWKQIISLISEKEHIAFFDSAYQGFASGNAEQDAQPFRYAVSQQVPILLAQSFAKNFGLYGERCGTLSVVCGDAQQKERILSVLRSIIRPMYSSPPKHGSSIIRTILSDEKLRTQYYEECASMARRIQTMRARLVQALAEAGSTHDWSHVTQQIGMFAFTGLTPEMCQQLTTEYYIFLTTNGRISIAGLNESNVEYVAKAIHSVSDGKSIGE